MYSLALANVVAALGSVLAPLRGAVSGTDLVSQIIQIIVSALKPFATGIGEGLSALAESIFLQTVGTGADAVTSLSVFGTLIIVFAAISLAIGLSRWVLQFVSSLGSRNR